MAFNNQNNPQGKQNEQATKTADATKANRTAEQSAQMASAIRDGVDKMAGLHDQAAENTKQVLQDGVDAASHHARETADRVSRTLGFSGEGSERLADQSKQNMEAVTRCGTVLTQAFQDASRGWFELSQKQWQRNLDGFNKLTRSKSVQEFTTIQSELAREGLQHMVQDSRAIAETSLRAVDQASKTFSSLPQQSASQG